MTNLAPLHSSKKHDWRTPPEVLDVVRELGPIGLDPCASSNPEHWFADVNVPKEKSNFRDDAWAATHENSVVFVNPPYGRELTDWMLRCYAKAWEAKRDSNNQRRR